MKKEYDIIGAGSPGGLRDLIKKVVEEGWEPIFPISPVVGLHVTTLYLPIWRPVPLDSNEAG